MPIMDSLNICDLKNGEEMLWILANILGSFSRFASISFVGFAHLNFLLIQGQI